MNIKPKEVEPKIKSNRKAGEDIVMEKVDNIVKSRSLQSLIKYVKAKNFICFDTIVWNRLPIFGLQTQLVREKSNENAFTSVRSIHNGRKKELKETENYPSRATHCI